MTSCINSILRSWSTLMMTSFCGIVASALLLCPCLFAESVFNIGRLRYSGGGDWYSNPSSLPNLQAELARRTSMAIGKRDIVVSLKDNSVHNTPFVYMTGHGNIAFTNEELARLRAYLTNGGFLWADDNFGMDESFRTQMKSLFPELELVEIGPEHSIFNGPFKMANGVPKIHEHHGGPPKAFGLFLDGRLVVFYTYNTDIGDGLEDADVHSDSEEKRKAALEMAINIVVFALQN